MVTVVVLSLMLIYGPNGVCVIRVVPDRGAQAHCQNWGVHFSPVCTVHHSLSVRSFYEINWAKNGRIIPSVTV